ncbi:2931_t:CDS:2 [Dentiscutata heterogama]|uniref:2931_t:CDS:1 n=1 Tax=Dentiscutata heterogama TaxID=1316150 RepID=A0ACA9ND85_9GLOM|nr:2931_t:CDS:2 [Dentiscutata heterogama]
MGCCCSKDEGDDGSKRMAYPRYDAAADRDRERESLQKIVQRTAEDFISTIKLDSKTLQKIQEKNTLPKLQNRKPPSLSQISDVQNTKLIPPHVVLNDGGLSKEDQMWLHKAMDEIHDAIDHIEVEYVGDLVVPLT